MKPILSNILFAITMLVVSQLFTLVYALILYYGLHPVMEWFNGNSLLVRIVLLFLGGSMFLGFIYLFLAFFYLLNRLIFDRFSKNLFTKIFAIAVSIINGLSCLIVTLSMYVGYKFMGGFEFLLWSFIILGINYLISKAGIKEESL